MAKLIKENAFVAPDQWQLRGDEDTVTDFSIITLTRWQAEKEQLKSLAQAGKLALHLTSDQTADVLADDCHHFALICIDFPKFADGRGYSCARLLRERYRFKGDLRAVGDVLIDQLFFMNRCGFSSQALRDDQDEHDALAAFSTFSVSYQNDAHDPRPLFRRRA
ncbi:MAG: DUF934 domain-containing protein [Bacterioplanes sp.]|nr:DUF934 domain-containing protein [Bacterioplanes sp.]